MEICGSSIYQLRNGNKYKQVVIDHLLELGTGLLVLEFLSTSGVEKEKKGS
jgi:hypothetical protein